MRKWGSVLGALISLTLVCSMVGCGGRELTAEEKAGDTNIMGNNPGEQPATNAAEADKATGDAGGKTDATAQ